MLPSVIFIPSLDFADADGVSDGAGGADQHHQGVLPHRVDQVGEQPGGLDPVDALAPGGEQQPLQVLPGGVGDAAGGPDVDGHGAVEEAEGAQKLFLLDQAGGGLYVGIEKIDHQVGASGRFGEGGGLLAAGFPPGRPQGIFEFGEAGVAQLFAEAQDGGGGVGDALGELPDAQVQDGLRVLVHIF